MSNNEIKNYTNKNGNMTIEEFLKNKLMMDKYFKTSTHKCPPIELIKGNTCFYCSECFQNCKKRVKEYKNFYLVKNKKYYKKDLGL